VRRAIALDLVVVSDVNLSPWYGLEGKKDSAENHHKCMGRVQLAVDPHTPSAWLHRPSVI